MTWSVASAAIICLFAARRFAYARSASGLTANIYSDVAVAGIVGGLLNYDVVRFCIIATHLAPEVLALLYVSAATALVIVGVNSLRAEWRPLSTREPRRGLS